MIKTLLSDNVQVGSCVIFNYLDKPCSRLIAIVKYLVDNEVAANYLSSDVKCECVGNLSDATPISKFGIEVLFDDEKRHYFCKKVSDSEATYADGMLRNWQENAFEHFSINSEVLKLIKFKNA